MTATAVRRRRGTATADVAVTTGPRCTCRRPPLLVAAFRDGELAHVEQVHWAGADQCPMPAGHIDPATWYARLDQDAAARYAANAR